MLEIPGVNNVVFEDELYRDGDVPILVEKLCRYSHHVKYARFELSEGLGDDVLRKCGRIPINIAGALEHLAKAGIKCMYIDACYRSDSNEEADDRVQRLQYPRNSIAFLQSGKHPPDIETRAGGEKGRTSRCRRRRKRKRAEGYCGGASGRA